MDKRPSLRWRIFRRGLFLYLTHAAGKVLLARSFTAADGTALRWLKPELADFLRHMDDEINRLRPIARLQDLPKLGNRIMVELSVLTLAAYRVLVAMGIRPAEARAAVADIGWIIYASQLRLASLPFRATSRSPEKRLKRTIKLLLRFPFTASAAPGYAVQSWEEGDDIFTHFTHCPPQSFARAVAAELGDQGVLEAFAESWCTYDWPGADIIAGDTARGHYRRRQTLSGGDPVCDMCWQSDSRRLIQTSPRSEDPGSLPAPAGTFYEQPKTRRAIQCQCGSGERNDQIQ